MIDKCNLPYGPRSIGRGNRMLCNLAKWFLFCWTPWGPFPGYHIPDTRHTCEWIRPADLAIFQHHANHLRWSVRSIWWCFRREKFWKILEPMSSLEYISLISQEMWSSEAYLMVELGLSTKLTPKVLGWISCRASNSFGNFSHIDNDGFDTVTYK